MGSTAAYVRDLQSSGRYSFTTADFARDSGRTMSAARAALRRLKAKAMIADPHRGFHVIVPPEYRELRCLPADQFLPDLMAHLDEPYYVALLSAAAFHGAAHQRPQVFQVMVGRPRRAISCGRVQIRFFARHDMAATPVIQGNTPRGVIRIATPEATALELIAYPRASGGLSHVATVLAELAEVIDPDALAAEAERAPLAWIQRLGHLLVLVSADALACALDPIVSAGQPVLAALSPSVTKTNAPRDLRWSLAVNIDIEPDL